MLCLVVYGMISTMEQDLFTAMNTGRDLDACNAGV